MPCATALMRSPTFKSATRLRRAAGDQAFDLGVAVFASQHRADPDEREAHVDAEVFQIGRAQIFRVRIVGLGERVEEELHLLVVIFLVDVAQHAIVAALDQLRARARSDVRSVSPASSSFAIRSRQSSSASASSFGQGAFWRLKSTVSSDLKSIGCLTSSLIFCDPVFDPLLENRENLVGRFEVPEQDVVIERGAIFRGEGVDIFLGEEEMAEIEQLEIAA